MCSLSQSPELQDGTASCVDVKQLSVTYGSATVVHSVSFHVDANSVFSIIGRNGAGKSSLVKALAGLVPVSSGSVTVEGRPLTMGDPKSARTCGVGVVPEGRWLWGGLSVEDNILLGLWGLPVGRSRIARAKRLADTYDRLPAIIPYRKRAARLLSGGQQQLVAIARAVIAQPRILVLDEPSFGLSPTATASVYALLGELRHHLLAVILIEQGIDRVLEVSSRIAVMERGKLVMEKRVDAGLHLDSDELWLAFRGVLSPASAVRPEDGRR